MIKEMYQVQKGEVFHFPHSLRPFVLIDYNATDELFLDIDKMIAYSYEDLVTWEGLDFYTKEDDPTFLGVDVVYTVADYFAKV